MMAILYYLVVGLIVGALGRLLLPGRQNVSLPLTIVLGILGAVIGGWLLSTLFGDDNASGGIPWIGLLGGAIVAAGLIVLYGRLTGRSSITR